MTYRFFSFTVLLLAFLYSCGEDTTGSSNTLNIKSISPNKAKTGDTVTITGNKFGGVQGSGVVIFKTLIALNYISWKDTEIKLTVPAGAVTGKVYAIVNGINSNEVDFTVEQNNQETYKALQIGSQKWMDRNLGVTNFRNGDIIPQINGNDEWKNITSAAWCYYNNDPLTEKEYGKLYNWFAVLDPRGLAPDGWFIPTDEDWITLSLHFKGVDSAGGKLKETGYKNWIIPNTGAANDSAFTALPGGCRDDKGEFKLIHYSGFWWTNTEYSNGNAFYRRVNYDDAKIYRNYFYATNGLSVRCIKY